MLGFIISLAIFYFVGIFGFSQIIGTLRYWWMRSAGKNAATLVIWLGLLSVGMWIGIANFSQHTTAFIIGYVAAFLSSLSVRPD